MFEHTMVRNLCSERCGMNPAKKKSYVEFPGVTAFMSQQPDSVRIEYDLIVEKLEAEGRLAMPEGEICSVEFMNKVIFFYDLNGFLRVA